MAGKNTVLAQVTHKKLLSEAACTRFGFAPMALSRSRGPVSSAKI